MMQFFVPFCSCRLLPPTFDRILEFPAVLKYNETREAARNMLLVFGGERAMAILFTAAMGILFCGAGIYCIGLLLFGWTKNAEEKSETPRQIVIEDGEESEEERQNREYGDFYGDSYYW